MQGSKAKKKVRNTPLVLATIKPYSRRELPDYVIAGYKCECGHSGAVHAGLEKPHCSKCGKEVVKSKSVATASVVRIEDVSNSISLECASCTRHNMMTVASAIGFRGFVHCTACGEGLEYDVDEIANVDDSLEDINLNDDTGSNDLADTIKANESPDDEDFDDEDEDQDDEDSTEANLEDEVDQVDELEDEDDSIENLASQDDDGDDNDAQDEDAYLGGDVADDVNDDESESDLEDESVVEASVKNKIKPTAIYKTLSKVELKNTRLIRDGSSIHMFAGNHCIASIQETTANQKAFQKKSFTGLIEASLKEKGIASTIEDYGFTVASVKLSKTKSLEATVASINKNAEDKVTAKVDAFVDKFKQALSVASVGFNRDVFANTIANPLKQGFADLLVSAGVDPVTASVRTQQVFAKAGDEYSEALLQKASELAGLGDSALNELATTYASLSVPEPNLVAVASSLEDEDQDEDENSNYFEGDDHRVLARLENPMQASSKQKTGASFGLFNRASFNH